MDWDFFYFLKILIVFLTISSFGVLFSIVFFSNKSPILKAPPDGWAIQMNSFFTAIIGLSFVFGQFLVIYFKIIAFQEIFFMLGTIIAYIIAFVIYFSFTMVRWIGRLTLSLAQPVGGIVMYYFMFIYTNEVSLNFFINAMMVFCVCAFIFTFPYARGMFHVSNIYRRTTGLGGYRFIRAFVLSMLTEKNDGPIEKLFDTLGKKTNVKIQYVLIRGSKNKNIKVEYK